MKSLLYTFCIILLGITNIIAQQLPKYNLHLDSPINPARVSSDYFTYQSYLSINLAHRTQWTSQSFGDTTPHTQFASATWLLETDNSNHIVGGHILNDKIWYMGTTGVYGKYAFVMPTMSSDPEDGALSIGLSAGAVQYRANLNMIDFRDGRDPIMELEHSKISFDGSLGIFYHHMIGRGDYVLGGLSVPQILGIDTQFRSEDEELLVKRAQHFYLQGGYYKYVNDNSHFLVSTLVKYTMNAPIHTDVNFRYQFDDYLWLGAGFSTSKAIHLEAGLSLLHNDYDNLARVGFSMSYPFGDNYISDLGYSFEINFTYALMKDSWY